MNFPQTIFSARLDHAIGWTVFHSIWQAAVIALLAGVVLFLLRNRTADLRYKVANAALFAIFLTSLVTFSWKMRSNEPNWLAIKAELATSKTAGPAAQDAPFLTEKTTAAPTILDQKTAPKRIEKAPAAPVKTIQKTWADYLFEHQPLIVLIWLLGFIGGFFRLLGSLSFVQILRSRMHFEVDPFWRDLLEKVAEKARFSQKIDLFESALVRSPLTVGFLKPVIFFPIGIINRLDPAEVEAILAHELAHILRRDYFFNLLQSLVETLFYFHPAVWWLASVARNERESACDDLAVGWTGDRLAYAKALVAMQEMAFLPQTASLAFAGTGKKQLLRRVERLFSATKIQFNMMEKCLAALVVACSIAVLAFGQNDQKGPEKAQNLAEKAGFSTQNAGLWQAAFFEDSICLNLSSAQKRQNWMIGDCFLREQLGNWRPEKGDVRHEIRRAAGTLVLTGKMESEKDGFGRFEFLPAENYVAELRRLGISSEKEGLMMHLFWADFPLDYVSKMRSAGFRDLDDEGLLQLAVFKIGIEEAKKLEKIWASFDDKKPLETEQLVQLKIADITPEKVEAFAKSGLTDLNAEAVVSLSMQGVDVDFIQKMAKTGLEKPSADQIVGAKTLGITPEYVAEMRAVNGGKDFTLDNLMGLKGLGIDAAEVLKMQNIGAGRLELEQIMAMKGLGIDADYIFNMQSLGLGASADDLIAEKGQGIDVDFVQKTEKLGFGKLDHEQLMQVKIFQITPEFLEPLRKMGFGKMSLEEAVSAKIHQVTPDFVEAARKQGFNHSKLGQYVELKVRRAVFSN